MKTLDTFDFAAPDGAVNAAQSVEMAVLRVRDGSSRASGATIAASALGSGRSTGVPSD